ncbi:hypothetical protein [Streptomyces sp. NBC_01217]|uniref:hypothetical protein n=1 Tax=Streptomyces sp. NBC_01217 TaxID=2903779 RepID=UPI002E15FD5F|nr:hypothetical protein OG507_16965 [Streptomyces sp. NBC_01217]
MSLTTDGEPPGPVRFYLACDRRGCPARAVFDLVIAEPPPDIETDLFGHVLHSATVASPYIAERGWIFIQQEGYWCPNCASPGRRPWSKDVTSS